MSLQGSSTLVMPLSGSRDIGLADQGNLYTAITPTPGTGIVSGAAVTTFNELAPYLCLVNTGNLNIYPLYMRLHTTVVGVGNTVAAWTLTLDPTNRYSSGGTALTINNTNMNSANKSGAEIYVGAVTATAASGTRRIIGHQTTQFALEIVHDTIFFNFGGADQTDPAYLIDNASGSATDLSHKTITFAPFVVGPGHSFVAVRWGASQSTGVTYEVEFTWIER